MYEPVQEGLEHVKENLHGMVDPSSEFLAELLDHVLEPTGKRVRPAITLLASSFHPHDERVIEIMATAVELLHIATLIHDDTVDNSDIRRGKATVSRVWGPNAAVLLGDYVFATSATFVCDTGNVRVIRRFAETIMELSSGELQEMARAYDLGQTRDDYLKLIFNKTASLFTTAGESGAVLSGVSEDRAEALKQYGYNLGMAFQIVDDVLDLDATTEEIGKPVGSDLAQGTLTLPAILAVEARPDDNPVRDLFQDPGDGALLSQAVQFIQESSAIDESRSIAREYADRALRNLDLLDLNPARRSLEELVYYVVDRRS